jgi:hypothetical protein
LDYANSSLFRLAQESRFMLVDSINRNAVAMLFLGDRKVQSQPFQAASFKRSNYLDNPH